MTESESRALFEAVLSVLARESGLDLAEVPNTMIECENGRIYSFNTVEAIQSGDVMKGALGRGPIFILHDGTVRMGASWLPIEYFVSEGKILSDAFDSSATSTELKRV